MKLLNDYLRERFGCKVYKIALNGGFTCPNRDGSKGDRGCIFCSEGGSGEFASDPTKSIKDQMEEGKRRVERKIKDGKYIAYFQAYTGTYAPIQKLRKLYKEAIMHRDVLVLSIATRPDCLPPEVLDLLSELNQIKPVWVELGLQTIKEESAAYIRRGYELAVYDRAVAELRRRGIEVITHVILGLPGESREDMLATVSYVCNFGAGEVLPPTNQGLLPSVCNSGIEEELLPKSQSPLLSDCNLEAEKESLPKSQRSLPSDCNAETEGESLPKAQSHLPRVCNSGIKLQLLHVLKGTDLAEDYNEGKFRVLSEDEYIDLLKECVKLIPDNVVIHRLTGDGDKRLLIAPLWSGNKKHVWNRIQKEVLY